MLICSRPTAPSLLPYLTSIMVTYEQCVMCVDGRYGVVGGDHVTGAISSEEHRRVLITVA